MPKNKKILFKSLIQASAAGLMTIIIYQFFYTEFIRPNVEDSAFDTTSWFTLSYTQTETQNNNVFLLLIDNKYLKSKELLDENDETNYGYILPRKYIADIISDIDLLVEDLDAENYPHSLFLDYDFSYLSDPNNKTPTKDDLRLLATLKEKRPYVIYIPMTSNYNFIYQSKDKDIQELIKKKKLRFVSVGLTIAGDGVSRRYYPYEIYKDNTNKKSKFLNIAVELWLEQNNLDKNISNSFLKEKQALIENRIIFKNNSIIENVTEYTSWQSNWSKLSSFSANYPLDMIYEESLKNSILMVGAAHTESKDIFGIDAYSKEISGVEMHANALMTLNYLNGKLQKLPLVRSFFIIFTTVFIVSFLLYTINQTLYLRLCRYKIRTMKGTIKKAMISYFIPSVDTLLVIISILILAIISYGYLISDMHYWFNWMIPAMMSAPYLLIMGIKNLIKKRRD